MSFKQKTSQRLFFFQNCHFDTFEKSKENLIIIALPAWEAERKRISKSVKWACEKEEKRRRRDRKRKSNSHFFFFFFSSVNFPIASRVAIQ